MPERINSEWVMTRREFDAMPGHKQHCTNAETEDGRKVVGYMYTPADSMIATRCLWLLATEAPATTKKPAEKFDPDNERFERNGLKAAGITRTADGPRGGESQAEWYRRTGGM